LVKKPGPKFDGKLGWLRCLQNYAAKLLDLGIPVVLAGDYNVMPTNLDVYALSDGVTTRCFVPR